MTLSAKTVLGLFAIAVFSILIGVISLISASHSPAPDRYPVVKYPVVKYPVVMVDDSSFSFAPGTVVIV